MGRAARPEHVLPWWAAIAASVVVAGAIAALVVGTTVRVDPDGEGVVRIFPDMAHPALAVNPAMLPPHAAPLSGPLVVPNPPDACSPLTNLEQIPGAAVLVVMGSCSRNVQFSHLRAGNPSFALLQTSSIDTIPESAMAVAYISNSTFETFRANAGAVAYYYGAIIPLAEPGILFLFAVAVGVVAAGAMWAEASEYWRVENVSLPNSKDARPSATESDSPPVAMTMVAAACLVVQAVIFLLLMFFFPAVAIYVTIVIFSLLSLAGLARVLKALVLLTSLWESATVRAYFVDRRIELHRRLPVFTYGEAATFAVSFAVVLWWLLVRNERYAWVLQDLLGIAVMLYMLQIIRLNSIKISALLLTLVFVYDIVMVFGTKVMIAVATQDYNGEQIPLLLRFPGLVSEVMRYSMLGYGDIVLPGFLIIFCRLFDVYRRTPVRNYFLASLIGYAVGLLCTIVALASMRTGQPALLYICPCTLGAVALVGAVRGELRELWRGMPEEGPLADAIERDDEGANELPIDETHIVELDHDDVPLHTVAADERSRSDDGPLLRNAA